MANICCVLANNMPGNKVSECVCLALENEQKQNRNLKIIKN